MQRSFLLIVLVSLGMAACSTSNSTLPTAMLPSAVVWKSQASTPIVSRSMRHDAGKGYKRVTVTINRAGGTFTFPSDGGFNGVGSYPANNAPAGAKLQITNSDLDNVLGVPLSVSGSPILFFEAQISGASQVTFQNVADTMTLTSTKLRASMTYGIAAYLWNQEIESYTAGSPSNQTLTFQTPLSGLSMAYYTPFAFELVVSPSTTPTPSPTPSPTPTPTPTPMPTPTPTPNPTPTPTPTPYPQTLYAAYNDPYYGGVYSFDGDKFGSAPNGFNAMPSAFALGIDDPQNLYVSSSNPAVVNEYYAAGGEFTYSNDIANPTAVAVDAGSNPAINVGNGSGVSGYQLLMFPQGVNQAAPLTDPNLSSVQSVTVDAAGNTYVGGVSNQNAPEVDLFAGSAFLNLGLQLNGTPTGLALDQAGNLVVAEGGGVAVFSPGQTSPSSWINYGQQPFALAFGNAGNWLYVLYNTYPCYTSCINVYAYPAGTLLGQYSLSGGSGYFGVALSPRVPLFNPNAARRKHAHFRYWSNSSPHRR
jgi:hypothetical protein